MAKTLHIFRGAMDAFNNTSEAAKRGYADAQKMISESANPYPSGSEEYEHWRTAFRAARKTMERRPPTNYRGG